MLVLVVVYILLFIYIAWNETFHASVSNGLPSIDFEVYFDFILLVMIKDFQIL